MLCASYHPYLKKRILLLVQAFILAQLIFYLSCSFFFFLTTFKSVDAAEIWLVTVSSEFIHLYLHLCKETPFSGHLPLLTEN